MAPLLANRESHRKSTTPRHDRSLQTRCSQEPRSNPVPLPLRLA